MSELKTSASVLLYDEVAHSGGPRAGPGRPANDASFLLHYPSSRNIRLQKSLIILCMVYCLRARRASPQAAHTRPPRTPRHSSVANILEFPGFSFIFLRRSCSPLKILVNAAQHCRYSCTCRPPGKLARLAFGGTGRAHRQWRLRRRPMCSALAFSPPLILCRWATQTARARMVGGAAPLQRCAAPRMLEEGGAGGVRCASGWSPLQRSRTPGRYQILASLCQP